VGKLIVLFTEDSESCKDGFSSHSTSTEEHRCEWANCHSETEVSTEGKSLTAFLWFLGIYQSVSFNITPDTAHSRFVASVLIPTDEGAPFTLLENKILNFLIKINWTTAGWELVSWSKEDGSWHLILQTDPRTKVVATQCVPRVVQRGAPEPPASCSQKRNPSECTAEMSGDLSAVLTASLVPSLIAGGLIGVCCCCCCLLVVLARSQRRPNESLQHNSNNQVFL